MNRYYGTKIDRPSRGSKCVHDARPLHLVLSSPHFPAVQTEGLCVLYLSRTVMALRLTTLIFCAAAVFGQETAPLPQPPPEVDAALRARIKQFYQAHVDGKFRVADQVVAEESKDFFFAAPKPQYLGYTIIRINYHPGFQEAEAVVSCLSDWYFHGEKAKVNLPITSSWKLIDGKWFWYVVPVKEVKTPFGTMNFDSGAPPTPRPAIPGDPRELAARILQQVQVDKTELMLSSYQDSTGEIKIFNKMQGPIHITADINSRFPGLTFELDKQDVKAGESATLTIHCSPKDRVPKPTLTATIFVEPTNQTIPVKLQFAIPPDIEKQIPKEARDAVRH